MLRKAAKGESLILAEMAVQMWDSHGVDELETEFASDCELNNLDSFKFHKAMGFDEANRIISFRKRI